MCAAVFSFNLKLNLVTLHSFFSYPLNPFMNVNAWARRGAAHTTAAAATSPLQIQKAGHPRDISVWPVAYLCSTSHWVRTRPRPGTNPANQLALSGGWGSSTKPQPNERIFEWVGVEWELRGWAYENGKNLTKKYRYIYTKQKQITRKQLEKKTRGRFFLARKGLLKLNPRYPPKIWESFLYMG